MKEDKKKRTSGLIIFIRILLMVGLATFAYLFLNHPAFSFQQLVVTGNQCLPTNKVEGIFEGQKGQNLFRMDTGGCQEQLMGQPMVAEVEIKKRYPDTLEVKIGEHFPVAYLSVASIEYPIDERGILHEPGLFTSMKTGNIFLSGEEKEPVPGDFFSDDRSRVDLLTGLVKLNLYKKVSKITFGLEETTSLRYNGISVSFGPLENVSYKLSLLDEIVQDLNAKGTVASEIHMEWGENPIIVTDESSETVLKQIP